MRQPLDANINSKNCPAFLLLLSRRVFGVLGVCGRDKQLGPDKFGTCDVLPIGQHIVCVSRRSLDVSDIG